jgi:hypothetical protein
LTATEEKEGSLTAPLMIGVNLNFVFGITPWLANQKCVLLMEKIQKKGEWKYTTMVFGAQSVIMDGTQLMQRLSAENLAFKELLKPGDQPHLVQETAQFGWITYSAQAVRAASAAAFMEVWDLSETAHMEKMLE